MKSKTLVQRIAPWGYGLLLLGLLAAPMLGAYPVFVMKLMCFALFASAFNLLLGYTGLLSFGHAAFLGGAAYVTGYAIKGWGLDRKSTRLNSSHLVISYAVFCLKKKN